MLSFILNCQKLTRATGASVHQHSTPNSIASLTTTVSTVALPLQTSNTQAQTLTCRSLLCSSSSLDWLQLLLHIWRLFSIQMTVIKLRLALLVQLVLKDIWEFFLALSHVTQVSHPPSERSQTAMLCRYAAWSAVGCYIVRWGAKFSVVKTPFLSSKCVWACCIGLSFAWETTLSKNTSFKRSSTSKDWDASGHLG